MEASEKPQLPLEGDAQAPADGAVRAIGDRLVIEGLTINDERVARMVRQRTEAGHQAVQTVAKAIEIGARVLDREEVAAEVDYVKREFERLQAAHRETIERQNREAVEQIEETLEKALGDAEAPGALGTALQSHSGELADLIAEHFGEDREGAVHAQIRRMLEQRDEQFMQRLSADDERNPLGPVLANIRNWTRERKADQDERDEKLETKLDELVEKIAELTGIEHGRDALEEAEEAGTRKGHSFEDRVDAAIERIAGARGDAASHTGGESAEGGGKKGDTLVELGAADGPAEGRIVFEAKDKKLSKNDAWRELNEGMAARAASFGVLVVAGEEKVPSGRETLAEYEGNKMIVAVDRDEPDCLALEVAYRLAAARVSMARDRELDVDPAAVRDAAEEAVSMLKQAQAIRSTLTGIKTSSDKARNGLDAMVASVQERLERIDSLVSEPARAEEG